MQRNSTSPDAESPLAIDESRIVYSRNIEPTAQVRVDTVREGDHTYEAIVVSEAAGNDHVVVVPVARDSRIGFVKQWRHALGKWTWELPRGFGEGGSAEAEAERELSEEMGLTADRLTPLGRIACNSGLMANYANVVLAQVTSVPGPATNSEISESRWLRPAEVRYQISEELINDSFTLAALTLLDVRSASL